MPDMISILPIVVIILFILMAISSYRKTKMSQNAAAAEPKPAVQEPGRREAASTATARPEPAAAPTPPAAMKVAAAPQAIVKATEAAPTTRHATSCGSSEPDASAATCIPEDSTLRRHYLTHVASMVEVSTFPRPSDATLRRHYEQLIASKLDECTADSAKLERLVGEYEACASTAS